MDGLLGGGGELSFALLTYTVSTIMRRPYGEILQEQKEMRRRDAWRLLPKDRRCPKCGQTKIKPKQWLRIGICKSCGSNKETQMKDFDNPFKKVQIIRYQVDGLKLRALRNQLGLTLKEMAYRIGWTRSWLSQLEVGDQIEITEGGYKKFMAFIEEQK